MKIQDLLKESKPCWKYAAMDSNKSWWFYKEKPIVSKSVGIWSSIEETININVLYSLFDIEPFNGDWKDSLICKEEC